MERALTDFSAPLSPPQPLTAHHIRESFDCGEPSLDQWLVRRALANQQAGASRTFVVCIGQTVVAYYCLAAGAVTTEQSTPRLRRNMPDPIPVILLGRLAVARPVQNRGIGRALLRDALARSAQAAEAIGVRGVLVHALSESAAIFYESAGFSRSPVLPSMLMVTLADLQQAFAEAAKG